MTNKEAAKIIGALGIKGSQDYSAYKIGQALTMAIDALEQLDKFERPEHICLHCNKPIKEGYIIGDLECYCSDECLSKHYSIEEYQQLFKEDEAYWTQWEE